MSDTVLAGLCAGFVLLLLFAERRGAAGLKWLAKPLASFCFVAIAFTGATASAYAVLIIAGLIFCMLGDILLIPKKPQTFLAGMGAFAVGHIVYIAAFINKSSSLSYYSLIAAALMAVLVIFVLRWMWDYLGSFKWPVTAYCAVIGVMVAAAFSVASGTQAVPYWPLALGALGFAVSDIFVARDQFVRPDFFNRAWGLPLYYGAQLLIASSV